MNEESMMSGCKSLIVNGNDSLVWHSWSGTPTPLAIILSVGGPHWRRLFLFLFESKVSTMESRLQIELAKDAGSDA